MSRTPLSLLVVLAALALPAGVARAADGFVPFDPAARDTISGAALMIAA
jgi:hypothetical protein